MDVSSVSSSNNAALAASLQSPLRNRAAEQDQQALQAQPTPLSQPAPSSQSSQGVQGTPEAQQSASSSERQAQSQAQSEPNRPTVNLNGQTVGTLVNTTA